MYDVHANHQLLNLDDSKSDKLSGGTDVLLGPYGVAKVSYAQFCCVARPKSVLLVRMDLKHFPLRPHWS